MTSPLINIEVEENTDYTMEITYVDPSTGLPIILTNYVAEIALTDPPGTVYSTTNGAIIITGAAGLLAITIPASTTLGMGQSSSFYNLFIIANNGVGAKSKIAKGFFTTTASVKI